MERVLLRINKVDARGVLILVMKQITVVAIGAGSRMNVYAELHPLEMYIVAVVDPNATRRNHLAAKCGIPLNACFESWESFLQQEKIADAVFICTPDDMHYQPTMLALERGYDVLLEKPIAQSLDECMDIVVRARELKRIVGVCHILRYHPYFRKFREIVASQKLGELISVNHIEAVGIERMTHAFVRGLWRESKINPMILSKGCHDLDLLVWLSGKKCLEVSSYGSLKWFRSENAPKGSTLRCTGGCEVEKSCPYSAIELYYRQKRWLRHFDIPAGIDSGVAILEELEKGQYGRCVYHCDNDVVDHQVVSMTMEDDVTINFSMDTFTKDLGRKTHFMFSEGEVFGDERILTVRYFHPSKKDEFYDFSDYYGECNFHGGADQEIVRDFLNAVRSRQSQDLLTSIEYSIESHRIAFEIERSRKKIN